MSKNHPGGLKGRKVKLKVAVHHANLENPDSFFVRLYKLYNSICPKDAYYLQPLHKPKQESWYAPRPFGHTKLDGTVCRLCREAGIPGYHTNHSLQATTATRLHQSGIQEQEIMERTGHRSLEGIRSYKRTSSKRMEHVSDVLNSGPKRPCLALHDLPKQQQQHSQFVATLPHANNEPSLLLSSCAWGKLGIPPPESEEGETSTPVPKPRNENIGLYATIIHVHITG